MTNAARHSPATIRRIEGGLPMALITPALRDDPVTIESVERRRAHLWLVAAVFLLACSTVIVLLFVEDDVGALFADAPTLRWTFLTLSLAFILYVVDQERRLRRLTAALIDERVLTAALRARVSDLAALTKVGRVVNSVLTLEEVLETIIDSVLELTGATSGSVMLLDDEELEVVSSTGPDPTKPGTRLRVGEGVAGWVASQREPVLITGRLGSDQFPGHVDRGTDERGSSVIAPLVVDEDVVGVLAVERRPDLDAFDDTELRSVAVFAEHAATAVNNAQRYEAERDTVRRLADVLEQRAEFVATMVHELKTPTTVILGFVSLLENGWNEIEEGRRREILDVLRAQGDRIQSMITEILRTASVEAGAEPRWQRVNVATLISEAIARITAVSEEREGQARLIRLSGADGDTMIWGDPEALQHVFDNLLENAVKFSPRATPIDVRMERLADEMQIDVVDRGSGIDPEESEAIFERFRSSRKTDTSVGLGLYIVRTLVEAHGGRVSAARNAHGGSTFTLHLPVRRDQIGVPEAASVADQHG